MSELLTSMATSLVNNPDEVSVKKTERGNTVVFELSVAPDDMGKIIGKNGKRAQAIRAVQAANAEGIRMIKEAGADESVLTIKSLEAFEKAANGNATKIIIPSEIQGLAGLATSFKEIVKDDNTKK